MFSVKHLTRGGQKRHPVRGRLTASLLAVVIAASLALGTNPAAGAVDWDPALTRYPYLTDVVNSYATINFATDRSQDTAMVRYGKVGVESCTANSAAATRNNLVVAMVNEYQWKAMIRVEPGVDYCYRVYLGSAPEVDLLGTDQTPTFTAMRTAGETGPISFAIFGDWGYVRTDGTNPIQAALMTLVANSGVDFAVTVGDNAYPTEGFTNVPGQTQYGDLYATGPSTSGVFGAPFWKEPGKSLPFFPAIGNHGYSQAANPANHPHVLNFPQQNAAALSNGRYTVDNYCCLNGITTADYASVWYAIDAGMARIYILEGAWANTNVGTADVYKNNYDFFFAPGTPHWEWLSTDLASHPGAVKIAVMHYPIYSDSVNEPSNPYYQGAGALEGLLNQHNVQITFSGHGHFYERNTPPNANSVISYIIGGGGANLTPIGSTCSPWDAYAVSWSYSSGGKVCGSAPVPTAVEQVHHIVKVTINGASVTVEPINALGQSFDVQTYNFTAGQESNLPSVPAGLTASVSGPDQVQLNWSASSDDSAVRGYTIYRNGTLWDWVTGGATGYLDDRAPAGGTYTYRVDAFDIWGNRSGLSNTATPGGTATIPVYLPVVAK